MPKNSKTPLALLFSMQSARNQNGFTHPNAYVVKFDGVKVRNLHDNEMVNGFPFLNNLCIDTQGENNQRERGFYGPQVSYMNLFRTDSRDATNMAKTLKKIDAGMAKLYDKRGMPMSFGEFVGRVAEVLGATTILTIRASGSSSYDEMSFDRYSIGDGVRRINWHIDQWKAGGTL